MIPIGAEPLERGVHFRVWAPARRKVEVVFESGEVALLELWKGADGYFSGHCAKAGAGMSYRYRLDGEQRLYPDPASRFQPEGPHGPSQIIDSRGFGWTDQAWGGLNPANQVLYELHIGTFTREGTFASAARELAYLRDLGVTCIEMMPVAEFDGRFGWGYDGVDLFAPFHHYGMPDDLRSLINQAHALGVGVILDVVYNHFGPEGNYLSAFSSSYFTTKHKNDWGASLNFDDEGSGPVREFFVSNARYWIREFHFDGFRFDATQAIIDSSPRHILAEIAAEARRAAGHRSIYLINENEPQETRLIRPPEQGGYGLDALWNDDFHHTARVALSGRKEAYYTDYFGRPQEFISAIKHGYLYQGQRYSWQKKRRGTPALDLPPTSFVNYLQNHDQVANSARGLRAHQIAGPALFKAVSALMLLAPQTPLLFQGQEFAASSTFHYFADHHPELAKLVRAGRARELSQFPSIATPQMTALLPDPENQETFDRSKLAHEERARPFHREILAMHQDLLRLRREEDVFRRVNRRGDIDGAVLGESAFVLRFFGQARADDRLLLVNLGADLDLEIAPEPLLAPPAGRRWSLQFSTEDPRYGGSGCPAPDTEQEGWFLPGRCAMLVQASPIEEAAVETRIKKSGSD